MQPITLKSSLIALLILATYFGFTQDTVKSSREVKNLRLPEMVLVKGGSFKMGYGGFCEDEKPVHRVVLDDFYLGKHEVTQREWKEIMGEDHENYNSGCDSCPVERISWLNIQEYLAKLNLMTGMNFRFPTEAEWEFAAKGGTSSKNYKFSGSNTASAVAWSVGISDNMSHPVGKKKANELGIYDMTGNVWEWCSDWYAPDYYSVSPGENPQGPQEGVARVMRGGSWFFDSAGLRVTDREKGNPTFRYGYVGFRLCRSVQ